MATKTTGQAINDLPAGVFKTLCRVSPLGALQARRQRTGIVAFDWRYSIETASERVCIGLYDSSAPPRGLTPTAIGHSIAAATRAAESLAIEHHQHRDQGGRPAILAAQREAIHAGKGRTANKLCSYARAAFQTAKAARSKPSIPLAFKNYGILNNPVADTEPEESQNRPDKRPMSASELRTYWHLIKPLPGFKGALLRLHLLTGGQRIEQLVDLETANITDDAILLHDGKGRPGRPPRPHTLPLVKEARKALTECKPTGEFAPLL